MTSGKTLLILSGGIEAADAARRAKEMGLREGTLAAEMMVDDGQLKLTDFSAILSGFFRTREIPRHMGVDFIGAAISLALGEAVAGTDLMPRWALAERSKGRRPPVPTLRFCPTRSSFRLGAGAAFLAVSRRRLAWGGGFSLTREPPPGRG
jgi:hypothetical protein